MKRISFFSWSLMLAVLASGLVFTGCSEDEDEKEFDYPMETLYGTWEGTGIYMESSGTWIDPTSNYYYSELRFSITFFANGVYYGEGFFGTGRGTYKAEGNTITTYVEGKMYLSYKVTSLMGNKAELTMYDESGDSMRLRVTKKKSSALSEVSSDEHKEEVEFKLDYTFVESGDMTRATGSEVYTMFYDKYIKTKQLTPTTYSLTFTNKETRATATINGYWKNNDAIRLPEGEYEVTGTSSPKLNKHIPSDTVYIKFNETVNIKKDMENLNLTAIYDSYLLLFDSSNSTKCRFFHDNNTSSQTRVDKALCKVENCFYLFIKDFSYTTSTYRPLIEITRLDKQVSTIYLNNFPFEASKYYYFNDMTNSFDIPMMESGN